jgi:hypothetical protein
MLGRSASVVFGVHDPETIQEIHWIFIEHAKTVKLGDKSSKVGRIIKNL